ncbi:MAG: hypothetical protein AB7V56_13720 [Candidatus Nitrosocosmicus sp.]
MTRTAQSLMNECKDILYFIKGELAELGKGPSHSKINNMRNIVVYGRQVSFILQKLRSVLPEGQFDKWYEPYKEEMKNDELMKFFVDLRNSIEKEGNTKTINVGHIRRLDTSMLPKLMGNQHPYATSFFMGDTKGRSGWEIKLPDGTEDKIFVEIPEEVLTVKFFFQNPPKSHLDIKVETSDPFFLCQCYYEYIKKMVNDANTKLINKI